MFSYRQSPLARVIGNNYPTTLEERELASQTRKDIDKELERVQDEITALQLQYKTLKEKDHQIAKILSPWRNLPPEILSNILQIAVNPSWDNYSILPAHSTDRRHFQTLRAVCRMWREVAFSTRSLWTNVYIDFRDYRPGAVPDVIRGVQKYFERAGPSLPLKLGFEWTSAVAIPDGWLEFLFSQRSRLTNLTFRSTTSYFHDFERKLKASNGSRWETRNLSVDAHTTLNGGAVSTNYGVIEASFPMLKNLHLETDDDDACNLALLSGHASLSKLHLRMYDIDPDFYFSKLGSFSNLKELTLLMSARRSSSIDAPTCDFPRLHSLKICRAYSFAIVSKIRAPSLSSLSIVTAMASKSSFSRVYGCAAQESLSMTFPQLVSFLQNGGFNLRDFYLRYWIQHNETLRLLLESLSSVQRLCLDTWYMDDSPQFDNQNRIVQAQVTNTQELLPNLRKICLDLPRGHLDRLCEHDDLPYASNPRYWSSFAAFLHSRASTSGSEGSASQPKLLVYLPEGIRRVDGIDAQLNAPLELIRELDGVSIAIETEHTCAVFDV
ncbi:hypothetical protein H1R20_g15870, partial [Candolleomyces eurysporus]